MIARRRKLAHRTGVEVTPAVVDIAADIALLLPWYVAGCLDDRSARRVDAAIRKDRALAEQATEISGEMSEVAALNNDLGGPSPRALHQLFAAIDAEQSRPALPTGTSVCALRADVLIGRASRRVARQPVAKKIGCCV